MPASADIAARLEKCEKLIFRIFDLIGEEPEERQDGLTPERRAEIYEMADKGVDYLRALYKEQERKKKNKGGKKS